MITTNPLPSNEELLALAAVKQVAQFALTRPTTYALFLMILTQWLTCSHDSQSYYLKALPAVLQDQDADPEDWRKLAMKLEALLVKGQDVALRGTMLLKDWQMTHAAELQLHLFASPAKE